MSIDRFLSRDDAAILARLADEYAHLADGPVADALDEVLMQAAALDAAPSVPHVGLGAQVSYAPQPSGETVTVQIVLPAEADPRAGRISVLTPVGLALLGYPQGAGVPVPLPGGREQLVTIQEVQLAAQPVAG